MKVEFFVGNFIHKDELRERKTSERACVSWHWCVGSVSDFAFARAISRLTCSNALVNWGNPAATSHCASHSPSRIETIKICVGLLILDFTWMRHDFNEALGICMQKNIQIIAVRQGRETHHRTIVQMETKRNDAHQSSWSARKPQQRISSPNRSQAKRGIAAGLQMNETSLWWARNRTVWTMTALKSERADKNHLRCAIIPVIEKYLQHAKILLGSDAN